MKNDIKAGADIHAGDGGYEIGTQEEYEAFEKKRNKQIYVRSQLNLILFGLLGSHSVVDAWWYSSNKAFDGKTPNEVYWSGEDGRQAVADYIIKFFNYQCS
jgi:hypothetical protein